MGRSASIVCRRVASDPEPSDHPLLLRALALANPTVRELLEMQYQFEEPFIVDSRKIIDGLGASFTPVEQALAETVDTYRSSSLAAQSR